MSPILSAKTVWNVMRMAPPLAGAECRGVEQNFARDGMSSGLGKWSSSAS